MSTQRRGVVPHWPGGGQLRKRWDGQGSARVAPTSQRPLAHVCNQFPISHHIVSVGTEQHRQKMLHGRLGRDTKMAKEGMMGRAPAFFDLAVSWQPARFMSDRELNITGRGQPPHAPCYEVLHQVN